MIMDSEFRKKIDDTQYMYVKGDKGKKENPAHHPCRTIIPQRVLVQFSEFDWVVKVLFGIVAVHCSAEFTGTFTLELGKIKEHAKYLEN